MRARTLLRISPGAWLAPVLVALSVYYVDSYLARADADPYPIALTARAITTLGFIAPICAALGAWEGGRLRRAGLWSLPIVRTRIRVAAALLVPIVLAGSLAVSAGALMNLSAAGLLAPDPRPLTVAVAVVAAHTAAGFALGLWLPLPAAVPGALLGSFLWMVMLRALDPRWLMMLNGETIELCCGRDTDLAPAAFWGPLVVAVGIALAAATVISGPWLRAETTWLSGALLGTGLVAGAMIVMPLGADPNVSRDDRALLCTTASGGVRVCVWPEHQARLGEVAEIAQDALTKWRKAGIVVPSMVTESRDAPADSLRIGFALASTPSDILDALAYGMVPPWPPCAETQRYPAGDAQPYLEAWLAATAGVSQADLASRWGDDPGLPGVPPVLDLIRRVRAAPPAVQREWVERNRAAMSDCTAEPQLVPIE